MAEWLTKFTQSLERSHRYLLAFSSGVDSVVAGHLLRSAGYAFGIAHVNFQLRGEASEGDAAFAADWAKSAGVPYYEKRSDTKAFAEAKKLSVQEAARQIRYDWLEEIRLTHGYDFIITAHHLNDSIETLLINLVRGTGIRGLTGIPAMRDQLVRPLLFASKEDILAYAQTHQLAFREDHTNLETIYSRNFLRLEVIPLLRKLNPSLESTLAAFLERMDQTDKIFRMAVEGYREQAFSDGSIDLGKLMGFPAPALLLGEWLLPFGFNESTVSDILRSLHPGNIFRSATHELEVDRDRLFLRSRQPKQSEVVEWTEPGSPLELPDGIMHARLIESPLFEYHTNREMAFLDADKLEFPLIVRHWRAGDRLAPLGMGGQHKKLQDLFSDEKIPLFEKEKFWIVECSGQIAWVVGLRLDERFKVCATTRKVWCLHFKKHTV